MADPNCTLEQHDLKGKFLRSVDNCSEIKANFRVRLPQSTNS